MVMLDAHEFEGYTATTVEGKKYKSDGKVWSDIHGSDQYQIIANVVHVKHPSPLVEMHFSKTADFLPLEGCGKVEPDSSVVGLPPVGIPYPMPVEPSNVAKTLASTSAPEFLEKHNKELTEARNRAVEAERELEARHNWMLRKLKRSVPDPAGEVPTTWSDVMHWWHLLCAYYQKVVVNENDLHNARQRIARLETRLNNLRAAEEWVALTDQLMDQLKQWSVCYDASCSQWVIKNLVSNLYIYQVVEDMVYRLRTFSTPLEALAWLETHSEDELVLRATSAHTEEWED